MADSFDRNILFCRMIGLLTQEQLDGLGHKMVAIAGAGGVGFTHAECIVREGIGRVRISDFDTFGAENMGRQFGCTTLTVDRPKAEVLEERLKSINPALQVERFGAIGPDNVEAFLDGVDFVCDAVDYFHVAPHRVLHHEARRRGIPAMIVGPQGYGCTVHLFDPDHMSFDDYFDVDDHMPEQEQLRNWGIGLGPTHVYRHYLAERNLDMENKTGSVISAVCLLCSGIIAGVALRRLLDQPVNFKPLPYMYHLDLVMARLDELYIPEGVRGIRADPAKYMR
jgi:molybdopterin/thiamine biosynthesis adenylyltransferase